MRSLALSRPFVALVVAGLFALFGVTLLLPVFRGEGRQDATVHDAPLMGPVEDGFVRRELAADEVPEEDYGIIFIDARTGRAELWRDVMAHGVPPESYTVDRGHRWLQSRTSIQVGDTLRPRTVIADRQTGESYLLDVVFEPVQPGDERWRLVAGPSPEGLLVLRKGDADSYAVVDLTNDPTAVALEFSLPEGSVAVPAAFVSPRQLIVGFSLVDLETGGVARLPETDAGMRGVWPVANGWVEVGSTGRPRLAPGEGPPDGLLVVRRFDGGGELLSEHRFAPGDLVLNTMPDGRWSAWPSPDGRLLAWSGQLPLHVPPETRLWPVVVLADLESGEVLLRVLRASAVANILKRLEWLSDGSALLVATPGGFALLRPNGSLGSLPFGPVEQEGVSGVPLPVPAPHDPGLFAYDGQLVREDGQPVSPRVPAADWAGREQASEYRINDAGDELLLIASPQLPRDFLVNVLAAFGLPAKVERPPFPDQLRLRVQTGGDPLNVRALPGSGQTAVGQLPDGALVSVIEGRGHIGTVSAEWDPEAVEPDVLFRVHEADWWVYVRSEAGLEGWVRSDYVTWAEGPSGGAISP